MVHGDLTPKKFNSRLGLHVHIIIVSLTDSRGSTDNEW